MPSPFSVLYPHALRTFPYAPPYLHPIPNPNIIVYKSSVLRLCTSVHISTKSPILLLEVPLCVSVHLRTSAPPSLWNQGQRPRQGCDTQVYAKSLLSSPLLYLRRTSGPPLWLISLLLPPLDLSLEDPDLTVSKRGIKLDQLVYQGNQVLRTPETSNMDWSWPVKHGKHS